MSYYEDVYLKRLNRFGNDYQSRLRNQRIKVFEDLLLKSIYRVDFAYNGIMQPGLLERYKQDDTQTLQYLLTRVDLQLHGGDLLEITDADGRTNMWMVYWLEYIEVSGYNRYVVMKMTHTVKWTHDFGKPTKKYKTQYAYFFGKQRLSLRADKTYGQTAKTVYFEDSNDYTLIMPYSPDLRKDDYFEVKTEKTTQAYKIVNFDIISTEGVQFVTVDPTYIYDKTANPIQPDGDTSADYDWFTGNFKEN